MQRGVKLARARINMPVFNARRCFISALYALGAVEADSSSMSVFIETSPNMSAMRSISSHGVAVSLPLPIVYESQSLSVGFVTAP